VLDKKGRHTLVEGVGTFERVLFSVTPFASALHCSGHVGLPLPNTLPMFVGFFAAVNEMGESRQLNPYPQPL
jgi:hypothetical protein